MAKTHKDLVASRDKILADFISLVREKVAGSNLLKDGTCKIGGAHGDISEDIREEWLAFHLYPFDCEFPFRFATRNGETNKLETRQFELIFHRQPKAIEPQNRLPMHWRIISDRRSNFMIGFHAFRWVGIPDFGSVQTSREVIEKVVGACGDFLLEYDELSSWPRRHWWDIP